MSQHWIIFHSKRKIFKCKTKSVFSESVLIAVGFYIGVTREYRGALPFIIVAAITVLAMIVSEVVKLLTTRMMMSTMMI